MPSINSTISDAAISQTLQSVQKDQGGLTAQQPIFLDQNVDTVTNASFQDLFRGAGDYLVNVQYESVSLSGSNGELRITSKLNSGSEITVARKVPAASETDCLSCGDTYIRDGGRVRARSDGSNDLIVRWTVRSIRKPVPVTVEIQGHNAIQSDNADTNFQDLSTIQPAASNILTPRIAKALYSIDLSDIPDDAQVLQANLVFTAGSIQNPDANIDFHAMLVSFTPDEVTYNDRSSGVAWDSAGLTAGTDYRTKKEYSTQINQTTNQVTRIDITNVVIEWLSGALDNNGLFSQFSDYSNTEALTMVGVGSGTASERPQLEVLLK